METNYLYYTLALLVLSSPFVALFIYLGRIDGWISTAKAFGLTLLTVVIIFFVVVLGIYLMHLANPVYFFRGC